jgi:hypothetical protein
MRVVQLRWQVSLPNNYANDQMDMLTNLTIASLLVFSVSAFATPSGQAPISLNGLLEKQSDRVHMISDGSAGGGGQDRQREDISVQVVDASGPVADAKCKLTNDKGEWSTTAPDTVSILRSKGDLTITCSRNGYSDSTLVVGAASTQIPKPRFRFEGDSDEDAEQEITVPYYNASVTIKLLSEAATSGSQ